MTTGHFGCNFPGCKMREGLAFQPCLQQIMSFISFMDNITSKKGDEQQTDNSGKLLSMEHPISEHAVMMEFRVNHDKDDIL